MYERRTVKTNWGAKQEGKIPKGTTRNKEVSKLLILKGTGWKKIKIS